MVESHLVSRRANDGSRDDMRGDKFDEKRFEHRDQRAETDTMFYRHEIDDLPVSERRKAEFRRMHKWQEGEDAFDEYSENWQSREQQNREEWKRRVVDTFTSRLELTDYQCKRTEHIVMDVLSINSFGHFSVEQVTIGVINCVARGDGRRIEKEEQFCELALDAGFHDRTLNGRLKTLRRMVCERVPSM